MPLPAIQVSRVTKRYGSLTALDQIDLEIRQGEFFGLLGPNGAGKTTLISAVAGLVRPDAGRIAVMAPSTEFINTTDPEVREFIGVGAAAQRAV